MLLLTRSASVLEQLSTETTGSVIDYREDGQPIRKKPTAGTAHDVLRVAAQAGAVAYAANSGCGFHRAPLRDDADGRRMTAVGALARLLLLPHADEIALLRELRHDVNLGTRDSNRLIDNDAARAELRCGGVGAVMSAERLFPTAELQAIDPALTLAFLGMARHGLDIRAPDMQADGLSVPVILADADDQTMMTLTAWPTHGGFYRLVVPIGLSRFTMGAMLGRVAPHVELASVTIEPVDDLDRPWDDAAPNRVRVAPVLEGLRTLGGALFACAPDSMVVVPPPSGRSGAQTVAIVFRPIGEIAAATVRLAA